MEHGAKGAELKNYPLITQMDTDEQRGMAHGAERKGCKVQELTTDETDGRRGV